MAGGCSMASSMAILSLSKRERVFQPVSSYSLLLNMSHLVRWFTELQDGEFSVLILVY